MVFLRQYLCLIIVRLLDPCLRAHRLRRAMALQPWHLMACWFPGPGACIHRRACGDLHIGLQQLQLRGCREQLDRQLPRPGVLLQQAVAHLVLCQSSVTGQSTQPQMAASITTMQ